MGLRRQRAAIIRIDGCEKRKYILSLGLALRLILSSCLFCASTSLPMSTAMFLRLPIIVLT
jgi:hypothetical protein